MRRCLVFVDESGDLGFGKGSSRHLTLVGLSTSQHTDLERILLKIRKRRLKKSLSERPELKFNNSSPVIRSAVLRSLSRLSTVRIAVVVLDKIGFNEDSPVDKETVYRRMVKKLIDELGELLGDASHLRIVFDTTPVNIRPRPGFTDFVRENATRLPRLGSLFPPVVEVTWHDSRKSGGLQVADFVAGAVQRKHEKSDSEYYDIIAPLISSETILRMNVG